MAVKSPETHTALVRRARKINRVLAETYPDAHTELNFKNPFQLLVATVLSAQTTDKQVNLTTPALFAKYPTPEDLAAANPDDVPIPVRDGDRIHVGAWTTLTVHAPAAG